MEAKVISNVPFSDTDKGQESINREFVAIISNIISANSPEILMLNFIGVEFSHFRVAFQAKWFVVVNDLLEVVIKVKL